MVELITALAIHACERLDREIVPSGASRPVPSRSGYPAADSAPLSCPMKLEFWRVSAAARMCFDGIDFDNSSVSKYCAVFSTTTLNEGSLPGTFTYLLNKVHKGGSAFSPAKRMIDQITYLAQIVLILSHIIEIESCEQIPLRLTSDHPFLASQMSIICKAPDARATVLAEEIFHAVAMLLSDGVFYVRDDKPRFSSRMTHFLFLWSDFGWSVYLDTVGDKDPAEVRRHLVHVKRGTPTNLKTNERKLLLRDGSGFTRKMYPDSFPLLNGGSYVPRCAAKVVRRVERWASRRQEFESTLYFDVQPSAEWRQYPVESLLGAFSDEGQQPQAARELVSPFEELGGYRKMQTCSGEHFRPQTTSAITKSSIDITIPSNLDLMQQHC